MTRLDVTARVLAIKAIFEADMGNGPACHREQDELLRDVLVAIAGGAERPDDLAAEALEVFGIEFDRWYE